MALTLHGYRYSVYTRIARMVLHSQATTYTYVEVNPFADPPDPGLARVTRLGLVPVLDHDGFVLCETGAITRYLCAIDPDAALRPAGAKAQARMDQVISVIDAYGYWPMVRQVFAHAVFRPLIGAEADQDVIADGLRAAGPVLAQLNDIAAEGRVLDPAAPTLADMHLAPMMAYFMAAPQAATALADHPALAGWWARAQHMPALLATDPGLATLTSQA